MRPFGRRLVCLLALAWVNPCLADLKITFLDVGQGDAALIQIDQAQGEPFTIIVDGGDGDEDLAGNLPSLLTGDPTI